LAGGIAAAGTTLAAGGNLKDALISGAIGGMSIGFAPNVGAAMPGAAGSFLNTALSAGAIGTAGGLLRGQSLSEALKSGAVTGITAAGTSSLSDAIKTPSRDFDTTDVSPGEPNVSTPGNVSATNPSGTETSPVLTPNTVSATNVPRDFDFIDSNVPPPSPGISNLPTQVTPNAEPPGFFSRLSDKIMPPNATTEQLQNSDAFKNARASGANYDQAIKAAENVMNPGFLSRYGPITALGIGALGLTGGFKSEPATPPGMVDPGITGETLIGQDPRKYVVQGMPGVRYDESGNIDRTGTGTVYQPNPAFQPSQTFATPQYGMPGQPNYPTYTPPMMAAAPVAGNPVPQLYNTMGMYNFLPSNQPRYMADGGIASFFAPGQSVLQMNRGGYPRKTGQISGPGTETSDDIPAMLSDGEFVVTAKAVRGIGNGSRRAGAKKLYRMMHAMEKKAGGRV
jgi:hypothetical protein